MRVAVYGGSFDPPHVGHAMVASWLRWTDRADEVLLVPAAEHAFGKSMSPFEERLELCRAFAGSVGPWVRVTDLEGGREGPSYTIDTLRTLAERRPNDTLQLVIGADNYRARAQWRDWASIERDFDPIVVGRAGYPPVAQSPTFPDVSSTEVRRRLAVGESVAHLVPGAVRRLLRPE